MTVLEKQDPLAQHQTARDSGLLEAIPECTGDEVLSRAATSLLASVGHVVGVLLDEAPVERLR